MLVGACWQGRVDGGCDGRAETAKSVFFGRGFATGFLGAWYNGVGGWGIWKWCWEKKPDDRLFCVGGKFEQVNFGLNGWCGSWVWRF